MEKDVQTAIKQYRELKATKADAYDFSQPQLNALGYQLLQMKRVKDAIEIFQAQRRDVPAGRKYLRQPWRSLHGERRQKPRDSKLQKVAGAEPKEYECCGETEEAGSSAVTISRY